MGRNVGENRREAATRSTEVCRLALVESCRDEMHRAVIHVVAAVQFERVGRLMIRYQTLSRRHQRLRYVIADVSEQQSCSETTGISV